jgi:ATP-dependent RNA helicase DDX54/DBP10
MLLTKNSEGFEKSFSTLGLDEPILKALERLKFT